MLTGLVTIATSLVDQLGYAGLAIGLLLNTMGLLIPSEIIIPLAGVAARQGKMNLVILVIVGVAAQTVGAVLAHAIGQRGGLVVVRRFGKYVLLSESDLTRAHRWFERYGTAATAVGFCLPLVRGYIGYIAGAAEMPRGRLAVSAAIGSFVWTCALLGLGAVLADNLTAIEGVVRPFSVIILISVLAAAAWFINHRIKERTK